MKRVLLLALLGALLVPAWAGASPIIVSAVGGSAAVVFDGLVTYQPLNYSGQGTIISKDQTSLIFLLTASYTSADLDFYGDGLRWTEQITNNTGQAWSSYSLELGSAGVYFTDLPYFSPTLVTVAGSTVTRDLSGGTLTLSVDRKRIDVVFASPIAPGGSFGVHTPIENLAPQGSFEVTETAVAVPEPASLLLFGTGLFGLAGTARRRTRK